MKNKKLIKIKSSFDLDIIAYAVVPNVEDLENYIPDSNQKIIYNKDKTKFIVNIDSLDVDEEIDYYNGMVENEKYEEGIFVGIFSGEGEFLTLLEKLNDILIFNSKNIESFLI